MWIGTSITIFLSQTGVRKSMSWAWPRGSPKRKPHTAAESIFILRIKIKQKPITAMALFSYIIAFHYSVHNWYPQCRLKEAQLFECGWKWDLLLILLCLRSDSYKCWVIKLEPDCLSVSVNTNATLQTVGWAHGGPEVGEADLLLRDVPLTETGRKIWGRQNEQAMKIITLTLRNCFWEIS